MSSEAKATVWRPRAAIIVRDTDLNKYVTVMPSAKKFNFKGVDLVAIPHKPDETTVLNNMGFSIPAPMNLYYTYPGRFTPFDVQKQTAEFASMNRRCFILNSMGLGKTATTLWTVDYLRSIGYVHKVLVVCPISVMERAWGDEIFKSFPHLKFSVIYGSRDKRKQLLADDADIYVVNFDGLKIIQEDLETRDDIDMVVIDEVAQYRNQTTARWKAANAVCNKQCNGTRRVIGLTGSPIPNCPTDAFGQIKLVNPTAPGVPKYFGRFRDLLMIQVNQFKFIPKADAVDTVHNLMQPSIRFCLDDAIDLPPQMVVRREVEMTSEQAKAYKEMFNTLRAAFERGEVLASNDAVKASKLLQISCGIAYNGETCLDIDCTPRMEVAKEIVEESEGKTIIFVPYTAALNKLKDYLVKEGHTCEVVDGSTSKTDRDRIFDEFQNAKDPQVLIANPGTMSHGLTLTSATTILWYGPCYSNEIFQQACARVRRPGQKRSTVIVQLISSPLEEKIYNRIDGKQSVQGALLDMIRDQLHM